MPEVISLIQINAPTTYKGILEELVKGLTVLFSRHKDLTTCNPRGSCFFSNVPRSYG